jgi:hypothetical protein
MTVILGILIGLQDVFATSGLNDPGLGLALALLPALVLGLSVLVLGLSVLVLGLSVLPDSPDNPVMECILVLIPFDFGTLEDFE